jgi:hypothetical protein
VVIALAVADEHAFGAVIKFGCSEIAIPSKALVSDPFRFKWVMF